MKTDSLGPPCVFSVDVEDWFHILNLPSTPKLAQWDLLPSRVEHNFRHLLEMFQESGIRVTCFFLGWVAQRYPHLVREASALGHEVASHGFAHQLAFQMGQQRFFEDIRTARLVIEDILGSEVLGYRAPGFSVNEQTPWFFDMLEQAGYRYDSSVFPARRRDGGLKGAPSAPYRIGDLIEFPISVRPLFGAGLCFFGGGYFRLFPAWLIKRMARDVLSAGRPVNFYIHPREIDPDHPRLRMDPFRHLQSYVNLRSTEAKILGLVRDFRFVTFADLYHDLVRPEGGSADASIHHHRFANA